MTQTYTMTVEETVAYPMETVWAVLQKPSALRLHGCNNVTVQSDTQWVEHTGENADTNCTAQLLPDTHTVKIDTQSKQFDTEGDEITIALSTKDGGHTQVNIHFAVRTSGIFNRLGFKLFGDKIFKFSENTILHHIEAACKAL